MWHRRWTRARDPASFPAVARAARPPAARRPDQQHPTREQTVRDGEASTPMVAQWRRLKEAHPEALLFFRMGDFYELFFADAVAAAPALEVALTRRGKDRGEEVPMCGVPVHAVETYLHRAIRKGFKVAVC